MEELKKENQAKLLNMMTSLKDVRAGFVVKETEWSQKEEQWANKEKEFNLKLEQVKEPQKE